mmetsp:Transcript_27756/g.39717  ORF Transcript_27756/g.39717 Transcript_27756/m.39717 type:complete len:144 (+) Transcript_27756:14-445(+)
MEMVPHFTASSRFHGAKKGQRVAPKIYSLGRIQRMLFILIVIGLLNYFFVLQKLSREPVLGVVYEDLPNFKNSAKKTSQADDDALEETPYFDLPDELREMVMAKERASKLPMQHHLNSSNALEKGGNLLHPLSSTVIITRLES